MNPFDDSAMADDLGDYWDQQVSGEGGDGAVPPSLDPTLAETIRRTRAIGQLPTPSPAYAAELWEELMQPNATTTLGQTVRVSRNPYRQLPGRRRPGNAVRPVRGWMSMLQGAVAALLLIGLLGLIAAQSPSVRDRVASFAGQEEPDTLRSDLSTGGEVIIAPEDAGNVEVGLYEVTIQPGATLTTPDLQGAWGIRSGVVLGSGGGLGPTPQTIRPSSGGSNDGSSTYLNESNEPAVLVMAFVGKGAHSFPSSEGVAIDPLLTAVIDLPEGDAWLEFNERPWTKDETVEVYGGDRGAAFVAVLAGTLSIFGSGGAIDAQILDLNEQAAALTPYDSRDVKLNAGDEILVQRGASIYASAETDDTRAMVLTIDPDPRSPMPGGNDISTALFGTPEAAPPRGTPTGEADLIDPSYCTVEPRSSDEIEALQSATPTAGDRTNLDEQDLPTGAPVDAATLAEITEVEKQFTACYNAGDLPRMLATMTDEVVSQLLDDLEDDGGLEASLDAAVPLNEDEMIALFPLRDARVLSDGRVGAIVDWGIGADAQNGDESNFHIYEQVDGVWLLAEEIPIRN